MSTPLSLVLIAVALGLGGALGYVSDSAEAKAQSILKEAHDQEKEIILEAKNKAIEALDEGKREADERRKEVNQIQQRLERREETFDKKLLDLEHQNEKIAERNRQIDQAKAELEKVRAEQIAKLEKIAGLTGEEAKKVLLSNYEKKYEADILDRIHKVKKQGSEAVEREAADILSRVIMRTASSHASETTTTSVQIPNDEMKGRIIGREGRNIKALENLTGVEIIVDDTPETIVVSGFSPIRRHLAKRVLEKLIEDGRIQPARIEEFVEKTKKEMAKEIREAGEQACYECGVAGLDPKVIQVLGRLKYRTSYGQNVLRHSIEVSHLSGLLAEELGANVSVAKKGGLLHDIGKAVDHEVQGGHPQIGYDIMKKYGLPEEVAYISIAHHEDEPRTIEGAIVKSADAISGARVGARKDTYENYIQRLEDLEKVAGAFDGIEKVFAIQAGREVRVFVKPEKIDDLAAQNLAREIASKIEAELKYPGEIRVTLIREKRITEYAR